MTVNCEPRIANHKTIVMPKVKLLNPISKLIAGLGLSYLEPKVAEALKDGSLEEKLAGYAFQRMRQTVDVITDDEANNAAQVSGVWLAYLNEDVIPAVGVALTPTLDKIESLETRELVKSLAGTVIGSLLLLTDDEGQNNEQLKAYFDAYIKSDEFRTVIMGQVRALAERYSKDASLIALIVSVFGAFFDLIQGLELDANSARLLAGEEK